MNVKLSNSQLSKLKLEIKNGTEVTLNRSSNVVGDSNDETNFSHKLLLSNTQFWRLSKAFANGSSANAKFTKTQLSKMIQSEGFIELLDKMFVPATRVALEVSGIVNNVDKGYRSSFRF